MTDYDDLIRGLAVGEERVAGHLVFRREAARVLVSGVIYGQLVPLLALTPAGAQFLANEEEVGYERAVVHLYADLLPIRLRAASGPWLVRPELDLPRSSWLNDPYTRRYQRGIIRPPDGFAPLQATWCDPTIRAYARGVSWTRIKLLVADERARRVPACWLCCRDAAGRLLGDLAGARDHLRRHIEEDVYTTGLLCAAYREAGYPSPRRLVDRFADPDAPEIVTAHDWAVIGRYLERRLHPHDSPTAGSPLAVTT